MSLRTPTSVHEVIQALALKVKSNLVQRRRHGPGERGSLQQVRDVVRLRSDSAASRRVVGPRGAHEISCKIFEILCDTKTFITINCIMTGYREGK